MATLKRLNITLDQNKCPFIAIHVDQKQYTYKHHQLVACYLDNNTHNMKGQPL